MLRFSSGAIPLACVTQKQLFLTLGQKFRWQPREMTRQVGTGLTKPELVAELGTRSGNEV